MQEVNKELIQIEKELKEENKRLSLNNKELETNLRLIKEKIRKKQEDNKKLSTLFISEKDNYNIKKLKTRDKDNQNALLELNKKIIEIEKLLSESDTRIAILIEQEDDEKKETEDKTKQHIHLKEQLDEQKKILATNEENLDRIYQIKSKLDKKKIKFNDCILLRQPIIDKFENTKELLNELKEINPNLAEEIEKMIDEELLEAISYLNNWKEFELME